MIQPATLLLGLLTVAAQTILACGADVTAVRSIPAKKGPSWKDSIDVAGAVGPRHVVDLDVAAFVVHDKATWEILRQLSEAPRGDTIGDARVVSPFQGFVG